MCYPLKVIRAAVYTLIGVCEVSKTILNSEK